MKMYGLLMILVLGFTQAQAKTILISDIDDTIKNSHVLDKTDAFFNAGNTENAVLGMNAVYRAAKAADKGIKFFYVTNAPKSLMQDSHRAFVSQNKFPVGALRLRDSLFQNDFKVTEIRKILKAERPDSAILIGDNGEKDILVYEQIKNEFPGIRFVTYIHLAYSTLNPEDTGLAIRAGQIGFATSLDLILQLRQENFVTGADTAAFVRDFVNAYSQEDEMNDDGPQALPSWFDCRDFQWTARDADLSMTPGYVKAKERILERCSIPALED